MTTILCKLKDCIHNDGNCQADLIGIDETGCKSYEQKVVAHWIDTGSGQECSSCHEIQYGYDNYRHFCANCGVKMEDF